MELPCPEKIYSDVGAAFGIGLGLSTMVNIFFGLKRAPKAQMINYTFALIRKKAPTSGGNFAIWGAGFSGFDCSLSYIRKKDDIINPIASGAITGGLLACRRGFKATVSAAAFGGIFIGLIEAGSYYMRKRMQAQQMEMIEAQAAQAAQDQAMERAKEDAKKHNKQHQQ
ncbi:hypothetical protein CYY_001679 [Polysphondylium violaceum]|uniref:Mitochondrial import inner membrane translocase subunit TIM17 n=1 Tax=Polysphondylium violaceum TaxID=133409 RepID=A0A8J4Q1L6_9MYCE|nr:hypothetical protein CYY_001679 [Polysphondylium violaceum]